MDLLITWRMLTDSHCGIHIHTVKNTTGIMVKITEMVLTTIILSTMELKERLQTKPSMLIDSERCEMLLQR